MRFLSICKIPVNVLSDYHWLSSFEPDQTMKLLILIDLTQVQETTPFVM